MKKLFIALSAAAAILAGCAQETEYTPAEKTCTLTVEVEDNTTKTYVEGDKIYWYESGEQLNVVYFADDNSSSRRQSATHEDYKLENNRATFTADFTPTDGALSYTLGAFYPYAYKSVTSSISLTVPQEQTPAEASYDPKADILVSTQPVVIEGTPDKVQFRFSRMVAIVNMTVKGIPAGELIEEIVVSSPAKPAGAVEFKVHEANTVENAKWYNNDEDITLDMGGRVATGEDAVWFTTVPTDLSGSALTVTVTTDKNIYTKEIDLTGKTLNFERADIARFSVAGLTLVEKPKTYKLLTDASQLTPGDQMVICTKNSASQTAKLLGTTAEGNAIKFSGSAIVLDGPEIAEIPADARIFTVESGVVSGTLSFKAADGYLYGNYDSENWESKLWVKDTKDEEASWKLSLASSYAATLYNETHGRYLNNYYGSKFNFAGSQGTYYYYIYYMDGTSDEPDQPDQPAATPLATPVVSASASGNTVTVSWEEVDGAKDYTVTCDGKSQTVTATSATFEGLEYATEYTVTVVANPADASVNTASEAGTATATTGNAPESQLQTITITFPVEGAVSGNSVGTIYNGDMIISSTGSWRTDSADGRDCIYIGRTTSNELRIEAQNGKTITKVTLTAPVGYLVDLKCKEYDGFTTTTFASATTAEWTGECKSRLVYTAAGNSHSNIASITVEYR